MNIIFLLHALLFIASIVVPFTNNRTLLEFYSLIIPFLMFHWITNDDNCSLTQMEVFLTGKEKEGTFFGKLLSPVYNMSNEHADKFVKSLLFVLWFFVQFKLDRIPGLNKIRELYK